MIKIKKVELNEKECLWNIFQKYLYEMTNYYNDEMNENGNYSYRFFDAYFEEPERIAYFIYNDDSLVGFTFLNPYSYIGHKPDNVIAEFTIFPVYRRNHLAYEAVKLILDKHKGNWEIKFSENNKAAKNFWETVTACYNPLVYNLDDEETVLEFSNI